jgi:hypothetical protein
MSQPSVDGLRIVKSSKTSRVTQHRHTLRVHMSRIRCSSSHFPLLRSTLYFVGGKKLPFGSKLTPIYRRSQKPSVFLISDQHKRHERRTRDERDGANNKWEWRQKPEAREPAEVNFLFLLLSIIFHCDYD